MSDALGECKYIYCRTLYTASAAECPVCGYPADERLVNDYAFLRQKARAVGLVEIIDMHQIIRRSEQALDIQLRMMEEIGVKKALLQSVAAEFTSLLGNNELRRMREAYREKFWVSHYIDPRRQDACAELKQCSDEGIKVVKLVPCIGFQPDDAALDRFWDTMQTLEQVAMVHTGFITARHKHLERQLNVYLNSRWANPLYFDQPARKFPGLQIILCHLGGVPWYREAAQMVTEHDNVWGDISAFGLVALRRVLAERLPLDLSKVFWGNDASANAYPFNLALAASALRENGLWSRAPLVFHDTAQRFAERFL